MKPQYTIREIVNLMKVSAAILETPDTKNTGRNELDRKHAALLRLAADDLAKREVLMDTGLEGIVQ